ncbi:hypothetical protein [Legionella bononiensis]|uniref:Uncharacterized protein n=1 Tax=Legionella bononiensis TaxID=2793102 RepID=A0ABS1WBW8_9GAMM|nr:hypothetical protein [Legionella bononiensis]MBL7481134.1 hypothetical protein [Legionella bononiensis]MBL7526843.1 hypothetical protein [Legionella bononiensis]MBL7564250.1 hypothetical protein [Legionella bononiensis]
MYYFISASSLPDHGFARELNPVLRLRLIQATFIADWIKVKVQINIK